MCRRGIELTDSRPSKIMINLWANNGSWSGPPSTDDVIMAIKEVKLYYNTSTSNEGKDEVFNKKCTKAGGFANEEAICSAGEPEPKGLPNISGSAAKSFVGYGVLYMLLLSPLLGVI